jgi:hypothetical protein
MTEPQTPAVRLALAAAKKAQQLASAREWDDVTVVVFARQGDGMHMAAVADHGLDPAEALHAGLEALAGFAETHGLPLDITWRELS